MNEEAANDLVNTISIRIESSLEEFRQSLVPKLTSATDPITPKVAFKLTVYREALLWRLVEMASSAFSEIKNENALSALILARSVQETTAALNYFHKVLVECVENDSVAELDEKAMNFLLVSKWEDWEYQSVNVLTMMKHAEKIVSGFSKVYGDLCEYSHPNYSGVALCFSEPKGKFDVELGRYPRGKWRHIYTACVALEGSLLLAKYSYNQSANLMYRIVELCTRDLEENLSFP